jgi:PAS domain S-box-containing protein
MAKKTTKIELLQQIDEHIGRLDNLRERLQRSDEIINSIHTGDVDTIFFEIKGVENLYHLTGSDHMYRILVESMNEGALTLTQDGVIIYCNKAFAIMMKTVYGKLIGSNLVDMICEGDIKKFETLWQGVIKDKGAAELEFKFDGGAMSVNLSCNAFLYENIPIVIAIVSDISEKKRIEEASRKSLEFKVLERTVDLEAVNKLLRENEEKYRTLFESMSQGVLYLNPDGQFISANNAAVKITGIMREALIEKTVFDPDWRIEFEDGTPCIGDILPSMKALKSGKRINNTLKIFNPITNDYIWMLVEAVPQFRFEQDKPYQVFVTLQDISSLKKMEDELKLLNNNLESMVKVEIHKRRTSEQILIQQSKMASMGEMIGLIAHQWRQPLNTVSLIVQNFQEVYTTGKLNDKFIQNSVDEAMRHLFFMSKTIDDFRDFAIPSKKKIPFDVKIIIEKLLSMFKPIFRKNEINILLKAAKNTVLLTEGYPNEFMQVILNILNNSKDAIIAHPDSERCGRINFNVKNDKDRTKIIISIKDNGGGIPEKIIGKIFEPYYTTKETTGGTGVGLYMSKTIIETNMGGQLTVRNIDGGAEFIITLDVHRKLDTI